MQVYQIIKSLLVTPNLRDRVLDWMAKILKKNQKRAQMNASTRNLATDGFMLNFLSVLQLLSTKVWKVYCFETYLNQYLAVTRISCRCGLSCRANRFILTHIRYNLISNDSLLLIHVRCIVEWSYLFVYPEDFFWKGGVLFIYLRDSL